MKDYYAILGLDAEASAESIKVAYRRLATQYHPDRMVGASAEEMARSSDRMREINEAYSFLTKGGKRRADTDLVAKLPPPDARRFGQTRR